MKLHFLPFHWRQKAAHLVGQIIFPFLALLVPIAAIAQGEPVLDKLTRDVTILTNAGFKPAVLGQPIAFGNRVVTGEKSLAVLVYSDGSKIHIGPTSMFEVKEKRETTEMGELHKGTIRSVIVKGQGTEKRPPRFLVRSRSVAIGVRGTDFVIELNQNRTRSEVHTLEGVVEAALTDNEIFDRRGVLVGENQFIIVDDNSISGPKSFDRDQYLRRLEARTLGVGIPSERPSFRPLSFRINPVYLNQMRGGNNVTLQLSANPALDFKKYFTARAQFGLFILSDAIGGRRFLATQLGVLTSINLKPLGFEFGFGREFWIARSFNTNQIVANILYSGAPIGPIELLFAGVSYQFHSLLPSVQVRAGVGVSF